MKFIKTYAMTLVLCYIFVFFGGWMLFDFSKRYFVATAACAFIIAVIASILLHKKKELTNWRRKSKNSKKKNSFICKTAPGPKSVRALFLA